MNDTVVTIFGKSVLMLAFVSIVFCAFSFVLIGIGAVLDAAKKERRRKELEMKNKYYCEDCQYANDDHSQCDKCDHGDLWCPAKDRKSEDCGVCIHADTDVCKGCNNGSKYKNEEEEYENT